MMRTLSLAKLALPIATISMVLVTMPAIARAQSVSGALGVSATILPPDRSRPPQLLSVSVARTGIARVEMAAPIAGAVSQIVMVTVSSPTNSFEPVVEAPTLVRGMRSAEQSSVAPNASDTTRAQRKRYDVDLGRPSVGSSAQPVSVRITYLIVPGT